MPIWNMETHRQVSEFKKTAIQKEATKLLSSEAKYAALFGGS
jgi:hypothetical protein